MPLNARKGAQGELDGMESDPLLPVLPRWKELVNLVAYRR